MTRYTIVSVVSGIPFGVLDGVINANPLAQKLNEVYKPLASTSINPVAGMAIDLVYGFILGGQFLLLYQRLPGGSGLGKGVSFALLVWFLRVVMSAASQWVMFNGPVGALLYSLVAGLGEMLLVCALYGLALGPVA